MSLFRGIWGSEPVGPDPADGAKGELLEQRIARTTKLGTGSLACPLCDAPVHPGDLPLTPAARLDCPYCLHAGAVRDFLSLTAPARPARVAVHVIPVRRSR